MSDLPAAKDFERRLGLKPTIIDNSRVLYNLIKESPDPWQAGKQTIFLTRNYGPFVRHCPGTRDYICCDYKILHFGTYCTMDCAYCILQSYFHPPVLQYFINHEDLITELEDTLGQNSCFRIGTGEFTDSLIWESWSDLTSKLIDIFSQQHYSVLELKTKTTAIGHLKNRPHQRKTILSWSLNTPYVICSQERGTSTLNARLRAAAQCQEWGYPLAFHFDPIVVYPGCESHYREVIKTLFDNVRADNIVWISLGTFRYMPDLHGVIQERFPQSEIIHGEFIPGLDGKMRYFKPLRIKIYELMVEWIRAHNKDVVVYLCMEDEKVWTQTIGFNPATKGGLAAMLDQSAKLHCDLK
ncbi:MAG: DNA photolyase [Desulfobacteraceae bacterium]|nr:DNA photolyase [Desulfobacteraceae bacterium]